MLAAPAVAVFTLVTKNCSGASGKVWKAVCAAGGASVAGKASVMLGWSCEVVVPVRKTSELESIAIPVEISLPFPETYELYFSVAPVGSNTVTKMEEHVPVQV